jgi:hypothetical protein
VVKSDNFVGWLKEQADGIGFGTALQMLSRHVVSGMSKGDFEALGQKLVAAHVPASSDWGAKLGFSRATGLARAVDLGLHAAGPQQSSDEAALQADVPEKIITLHGEIRIARIPDGRYALRSEKSEQLIEVLKEACRGRARWNPRYRNWLVSGEDIQQVLAVLDRSGGI